MSYRIYFVTTSANKFNELSTWLAQLAPDINLEQCALDLPEIQSLDLKEVAVTKAKDAWKKIGQPLLVDDAGMFLDTYPLFPGPLTKFVHQAIGMEGIVHMAGANRKASFRNCLVYMTSPENYQVFEGVMHGILIDPALKKESGKPLHCIDVLIPEGYDKTFAELLKMSDNIWQCHYRYVALRKFVDFL